MILMVTYFNQVTMRYEASVWGVLLGVCRIYADTRSFQINYWKGKMGIYSDLRMKIKILGYYSFMLQDVEEDEKDCFLMSHSERLAIVYEIISEPPKTLIRICECVGIVIMLLSL